VSLRKVLIDTNIYVDWLNERLHESVVIAPGFVRYLSTIVQMELRAGATTPRASRAADGLLLAYRAGGRIVVPTVAAFDAAGKTLRALRARGIEVRRASLVNDVLIAQSARAIGAAVVTRDGGFEVLRRVMDFELQFVAD
jgi:predicted nucleic acid-binding protein